MKSFLFILLVAVAVSAQQPQYQPKQSEQAAPAEQASEPQDAAQAETPAQPAAEVPAQDPAEVPLPGAAPKPGHPLDPADVQTLISKPVTSVSPAARSGYAPQVYYYYPNDVPLFGYPYGYPHGLRIPRSFHSNQPLLQLGTEGTSVILPLAPKHKAAKTTKPRSTTPKK